MAFILMTSALVASCSNEGQEAFDQIQLRINPTIKFNICEVETKTAFGQGQNGVYPTRWTSSDEAVKLALNYTEAAVAAVVPSADFRTASFSADVDASATSAPYTFFAVSPASAAKALSPSRKAWNVTIPSVQTPLAGSVDESAMLLAAASVPSDVLPSSVDLHFSHLTAYGRMSFKNLELGDATITRVEMTASAPFVGDWYWDCSGNHALTDNGASSTLTIMTSATSDIWFACAPVDMSGQKAVFTIYTDQGIFFKEVEFPQGRKFNAGRIAVFSVDMAGIEMLKDGAEYYVLVTSASELQAGDEIIIANTDGTYALGPKNDSGNTPYRQAVDITVAGNKLADSGLASILTLEEGSSPGAWALKASDGYLSTTSTSNSLSTSSLVMPNSTWNVSINGAGEASVVAMGGTYKYLRFNYNSGLNPRFIGVASNSSLKDPVAIYRKFKETSIQLEEDPLTENVAYGIYQGANTRTYNPGDDQYSRHYQYSGEQTFTILNQSTNEQLEISGYRKSFVKGDIVTIVVNWRVGRKAIVTDKKYYVTVVKEEGPKVWLGDGSGKGFIIKKYGAMKKIFAIIVAGLIGFTAAAIPAYPGLIPVTQPDGSVIYIQKHGDEFCHWTTNTAGQEVAMEADGYWRPVKNGTPLNVRRQVAQIKKEAINRSYSLNRGVASGMKHFLVILVEFSDVKFSGEDPHQDFDLLLNQPGYSINGGTGSARDYYYENSHGYFEPVFDVYGPVTLSGKMADYGGNDPETNFDKNAEGAVKEGCELLDDQIDFSNYDLDLDGKVDLVFMYYAGYGEADSSDSNSIWPHQWDFDSAGISLTCDGKKIYQYACSNELNGSGALQGKLGGIGTVCHEFGHAMGLPDFYDTDYETNEYAGGLYRYSLMSGGSYNNEGRTPPFFNIEERILLGWLGPGALKDIPKTGDYVLNSVNDNLAYKSPTELDGEYFVYECRTKDSWDKYITEAGMIVYHVDKSSRRITIVDDNGGSFSIAAKTLWDQWHLYNSINENGLHPCFYIVPAGSQASLRYTGSRYAFPGAGNVTTFTAKSWNEIDSETVLSDITFNGTQVSFHATVPAEEIDYNVIANPGNGVYAAGSLFEFKLIESELYPATSVSWFFDDEPVSASSVRLKAGAHTVEAEINIGSGYSYTVTLEILAQ